MTDQTDAEFIAELKALEAERDAALARVDALRAAMETIRDQTTGYPHCIASNALGNSPEFPDSSPVDVPEPPVSGWLPIEAAPSAKAVLVAYKNRSDKWRVVKAVRYEQYQNEQPADDDEGEVGEYCEEKDAYFVRAGWYELIDNWDDFGFVAIYEGDPVAWMNLPAPPKHQTLGPMTESRFILTPWGLLTVSIAVATGTQEPK